MNMQSKSGVFLAVAVLFTVMLAGRAMTLGFLAQVGSPVAGSPPMAWLMPLVGDAVVGLSAPVAAVLLLRGRGLGAWSIILLWNAIGIWDAMSAFLVHLSVPWPDFFMVQIFGASMFFAASAMHLVVIALVAGPLRDRWLPAYRSTRTLESL